MKIFPSKKYLFYSSLNEEEVMAAVSNELMKNNPNRTNAHSRIRFEGFMNKNSFKLNEITTFEHTFKPRVYGRLLDETTDTIIEISIKPSSGLKFFMAWIIFLDVFIISLFLYNYLRYEKIMYGVPGALACLLILYVILILIFNAFAKELISPLAKILKTCKIERWSTNNTK